MNKEAYYKPSGKISGLYILLFLVFAAIGIPILSVTYIYAVYYIPIIYISIFIAVGCGGALGYIMSLAAKLGKARNPLLVTIFTVFAAVLMKYVQWCFYIPLVYNDLYEFYEYYFGYALTIGEQLREAVNYFREPAVVWACIVEVNEYGAWGITNNGGDVGDAVTGVMLAIVWVIEFLIMAGLALLGCRNWPKRPYSEDTNTWYRQMDTVYEMDYPANFENLKNSLESGNIDGFVSNVLEGVSNPNNLLRLTFFQPSQPSHTEPYYMNISHVFVDDKGKSITKELASYLAMSTINANALFNAEPVSEAYTPEYNNENTDDSED